jgi:hypothetical protein
MEPKVITKRVEFVIQRKVFGVWSDQATYTFEGACRSIYTFGKKYVKVSDTRMIKRDTTTETEETVLEG